MSAVCLHFVNLLARLLVANRRQWQLHCVLTKLSKVFLAQRIHHFLRFQYLLSKNKFEMKNIQSRNSALGLRSAYDSSTYQRLGLPFRVDPIRPPMRPFGLKSFRLSDELHIAKYVLYHHLTQLTLAPAAKIIWDLQKYIQFSTC